MVAEREQHCNHKSQPLVVRPFITVQFNTQLNKTPLVKNKFCFICFSCGLCVVVMIMNGRNRFPFTPSQWQELEHQALIYKYMASGRCRRTDGKKWRCSKEAYADSKYCERHMHRGKNRSRKPVEHVLKTSSTPTTTTKTTSNTDVVASASTILSITKNSSPGHPTLSPTTHSLTTSFSSHGTFNHSPYSSSSSHLHHSFFYHHLPQPSRHSSSSVGFSFQDNNTAPMFLDNNNNTTDCRYVYGLKEEVDEHAFFSTEPSGTMRSLSASSMDDDDSWQLTPLTISSSSSSKQRSCSALSNDNNDNNENEHSYLQLQSLSGKDEPQKTIHRFFDEWPHKSRSSSWLDLDDKSSTTQLSISIPTSFS